MVFEVIFSFTATAFFTNDCTFSAGFQMFPVFSFSLVNISVTAVKNTSLFFYEASFFRSVFCGLIVKDILATLRTWTPKWNFVQHAFDNFANILLDKLLLTLRPRTSGAGLQMFCDARVAKQVVTRAARRGF